MKNSVYPIDLVELTTEKDSLNQVVEKTRTTNTVFAEVSSVSQTEFFSGGRIGLQPSIKAVIYDFEYNDEPIIKLTRAQRMLLLTRNTSGRIICMP